MATTLVCCGLKCFIITHNHSHKIVKQLKNICIFNLFYLSIGYLLVEHSQLKQFALQTGLVMCEFFEIKFIFEKTLLLH